MWRVVSVALFAFGITPVLWARDVSPQGPRTPCEGYEAVVKEYQQADGEFWGTYRKIKLPSEQRKFFVTRFPRPERYIARFLEIVESAPRTKPASTP